MRFKAFLALPADQHPPARPSPPRPAATRPPRCRAGQRWDMHELLFHRHKKGARRRRPARVRRPARPGIVAAFDRDRAQHFAVADRIRRDASSSGPGLGPGAGHPHPVHRRRASTRGGYDPPALLAASSLRAPALHSCWYQADRVDGQPPDTQWRRSSRPADGDQEAEMLVDDDRGDPPAGDRLLMTRMLFTLHGGTRHCRERHPRAAVFAMTLHPAAISTTFWAPMMVGERVARRALLVMGAAPSRSETDAPDGSGRHGGSGDDLILVIRGPG